MSEHPILSNDAEVRAFLNGTKTRGKLYSPAGMDPIDPVHIASRLANRGKGKVMSKVKTIVRVRLNEDELLVLDNWRRGMKAMGGRMVTRSVAITAMIATLKEVFDQTERERNKP